MTIMRGGPGAGKSYYVAQLCFTRDTPPIVCSADDFFIDDKGNYKFDPAWLGRAHGACFKQAVEAVIAMRNVVIDNTNAKPQDMIPYLALCQAFGYTCKVVRVLCDPDIAWRRQKHDVPLDTFNKIHTTVSQQKVPRDYRDAPWLTCEDIRSDDAYRRPNIVQPYSGAICVKCRGVVVLSNEGGASETYRVADHEADTCSCTGAPELGEPFSGRPPCNCGVSLGIRNDHEAECRATYIQRKR